MVISVNDITKNLYARAKRDFVNFILQSTVDIVREWWTGRDGYSTPGTRQSVGNSEVPVSQSSSPTAPFMSVYEPSHGPRAVNPEIVFDCEDTPEELAAFRRAEASHPAAKNFADNFGKIEFDGEEPPAAPTRPQRAARRPKGFAKD